MKTFFTIGHSTHSTREFMNILKSFEIKILVDVRHYPGSRHCPQFGQARLKRSLARNGIRYVHLESLGGRRRPLKTSDTNSAWRSSQFRGYADFMQTKEFRHALSELLDLGKSSTVALMCAEAVPWRCHRSLIADALIAQKKRVFDIYAEGKAKEHSLTSFAHVHRRRVTYPKVE